jgi:DNA-binding transcriptional MocR family regulator
VPIIEDDTYRELSLRTPPPPSLYELDEMHTIVIHLNTFSKTLVPGLRLGWITAVRPIVEQLALIKQRVDLHTQNLSQLVVADLLETGAFDRHVAGLRGEHRLRRDAMVQALGKHVGAGLLRFTVPEGGMFLWCQLTGHVRADVVQRHALRDAIVFVTGEPFYADRGGTQELRICYTAQPPDEGVRAAKCLARSITEARQEMPREAPAIAMPMA